MSINNVTPRLRERLAETHPTYTDGTVWAGLVTLLLASDQISWQPESEVS